ncbi:lamin tail domain-containing protein, partial [bacterium]|nr:lamin tail domain-containing protein [bacterium]
MRFKLDYISCLAALAFILMFCPVHGQIVIINEIMYDQGAWPEWVELYNCSSEDSAGSEPREIDLQGWSFADGAALSSPWIISSESLILGPGEFIILTYDSSGFAGSFCDTCCPIIKPIGWNSYQLNNTGDIVALFNDSGMVEDSFSYSGGCDDISLERVKPWISGADPDNWACCADNGTPCRVNSVSPLASDLALEMIWTDPEDPEPESDLVIKALVRSAGYSTSPASSIAFYADTNLNSEPDPQEMLGSPVAIEPIPGGDSTMVSSIPVQLPNGNWTLIARLADDAQLANNEARMTLRFLDCPLIINEIMYDPPFGPEWIEILNRSGMDSVDLEPITVNIQGWALADEPRYSSPMLISTTPLFIRPGEYAILTYDYASFTDHFCDSCCVIIECEGWDNALFNNTGDMVALFDSSGEVVDSFEYPGRCNGQSRERIACWKGSPDTSNWGCAQGIATPCGLNSLSTATRDLDIINSYTDPENPSTLEEFRIVVDIKNRGFLNSEENTVQFYLDRDWDGYFEPSELIGSVNVPPLNSEEVQEFSIIHQYSEGYWKILAALGPDERISNNEDTLLVVIGSPEKQIVINEYMNTPSTGNPEWVEIYNRSDTTVSINGWYLGDGEDMHRIFSYDLAKTQLLPGNYMIITGDSLRIKELFPCSCKVIQSEGWEALNNTDDVVVLRNNFGITQDSLAYDDAWTSACDNYDISIERIDPERPSNQMENWWCSKVGATPCGPNSVS